MVLVLSAVVAQSWGPMWLLLPCEVSESHFKSLRMGKQSGIIGEKGAYRSLPTPRAAAANFAFISPCLLCLLTLSSRPPKSALGCSETPELFELCSKPYRRTLFHSPRFDPH